MDMSKIDIVAKILVILGAINWGLVGIFGLDLVSYLPWGLLQTIVYVLIGISGLWMVYGLYKEYNK